MIASLAFITSLTLVALHVSTKLWNSKFSTQEKTLTVTVIFGVLSLIIIANEARNSDIIQFSLFKDAQISSSSQIFYKFHDQELAPKLENLPISSSFFSTVSSSLFEDSQSSTFAIITSQDNQGASLFLKELAQGLNKQKQPVAYLRLSKPIANEDDIEQIFYGNSFEKIEKEIQHILQRKTNSIPTIIIDNCHFALYPLSSRDNLLINSLVNFKLQYNIRIILHSHANNIVPKLFQINGVFEVAQFKRYPLMSVENALSYLQDKFPSISLNETISNDLTQLSNLIGLDFEILSKFIHSVQSNESEALHLKILQMHKAEIERDPQLKMVIEAVKGVLELREFILTGENILSINQIIQKVKNPKDTLQYLQDEGIIWLQFGMLSIKKAYLNSQFIL